MHPTYDFSNHVRGEEWLKLDSAKVIVVEGILLFENQDLVDMLDIKIFVDTDADVRILRRLVRDVKERGRNLDSVVKQYLTTVKPMHERFVEPSKRLADVIVPVGGHNDVAFNMIINTIKRKIAEQE
jgi:uridine kinase